MNIKIINSCSKNYSVHPEKVISRILEKIPEKFLEGLEEIRLVDDVNIKAQHKSYRWKMNASQHGSIEIFMNDPRLSGWPLFPILLLNLLFFFALNEHIQHYLIPHSHDEEILSYTSSQTKYAWFYLGIWNPFLYVFRSVNYLISRFQVFQRLWSYLANRVLNKASKK